MNTKDIAETAKKLEEDAHKLREAVEIIERARYAEPVAYTGTRAEQLTEYINKHGGSASRTEIISESGIPAGTVASLLGSKKKFTKDTRGFWHPKPKQEEKHSEMAVAQA